MTTRRLFWPTLMTTLAALLLLGLGTWQLERKAWKEALVARIAEQAKGEPIILDAATSLFARGDEMEYARVRARGRWHTDKSRLLYALTQAEAGFHVYTPLETPSGAILFVNRGFVPRSEVANLDRGNKLPREPVEVVGLLRRPGSKSWFEGENAPAKNEWYWRDLDGMAQSVLADRRRDVLPFFLDAEATPGATSTPWPRSGVTRVQFPNRHLEYALTWYGLAIALIGVYFAFLRKRHR
jgi:surfeit locus 1 family protein